MPTSPQASTHTPRPVATAQLRDGSRIDLRPVTGDDKALLVDGFHKLSPRARYLRFFAPANRLSLSQVAYLAEVDQSDHVAWGVLDGDAPVAIARWVRFVDAPAAADVAVTVIDDYQGRGIGRLLLQVLAVSARARGVGTLHFDVLAENDAMNGLLASLGAERNEEYDIVHHVLDVARVPAPPIVAGDLIGLLEDAHREASARVRSDRVPN